MEHPKKAGTNPRNNKWAVVITLGISLLLIVVVVVCCCCMLLMFVVVVVIVLLYFSACVRV